MRHAKSFVLCAVLIVINLPLAANAGEPARWLRYPSISPDGETIIFSARGNLWRVPSSGGEASAVTLDPAHEIMPVWSADGRFIAYASDRHGNYDIFLVPAGGGEARRLTFHSAADLPTSFTPAGDAVLFTSSRLDAYTCVQFPSGSQPELYSVPVSAGMPRQLLTTPAMYAVYDRAGERLAYSDQKGLEDRWRKHDQSSFARDLWLYDPDDGSHRRLTDTAADDRQPVWAPDQQSLYYLGEASGSFNVWHLALDGTAPYQVTDHTVHPVRFLSSSASGDLCYAFDGDLWLRPAAGDTSQRLEITMTAAAVRDAHWFDPSSGITEMELSPDGAEIAFVARGEVFVTASEHPNTRRITSTAGQERSLWFAPDGRSLYYSAERGGSWGIFRSVLADDDEKHFFNAATVVEQAVVNDRHNTFQPVLSPDGKQLAYLEDRTTLKVLELDSGSSRTLVPAGTNYSYVDGDQWYRWSPDGRWLAVELLSAGRYSTEVALVPVDGGEVVNPPGGAGGVRGGSSGSVRGGRLVNLTRSGYEDQRPRWNHDGTAIYWLSDRHGMRRHSGFGSQDDVFAAFLTRTAWQRHQLDKAAFEQLQATEKKAKKAKKEKGEDDKDRQENEEPKLAEAVDLELDGIEDRMARLTLHPAALADARLVDRGERLLYLARFEKGYDLWGYQRRKSEVKLVVKLGARRASHLAVHEDKNAYLLADGGLTAIDLEKGTSKPLKMSARMQLAPADERAYLFEHVWRQTAEKFYTEGMHGADWSALKQYYAAFLDHLDNNRDFAELLSEMLGELNASHTGASYRPRRSNATATASLAFFPDPTHQGAGIRIAEIIDSSPLLEPSGRIAVGTVIEAIASTAIAAGANWYPLLDHMAGVPIRLDLFDPVKSERWHQVVRPISRSRARELLERRWARSRRDEVERLSNGRLGYAHIRSMGDGSYRQVFEQVFGRHVNKEALIIDTRFNNGGDLDEPLTAFLSGEVFARNWSRGHDFGAEPHLRWSKPSIVLVNEGNYSDAHCFPAIYSNLGLGETVGMPVPGTCTAVWWETLQDPSLRFGIPQLAWTDPAGVPFENRHHLPDHQVDNDPELESAGRDQQLELAVQVMLQQLDATE